jgi:two-component system, chemotaxis family, protein-glutamate methylesterase/glutaminase
MPGMDGITFLKKYLRQLPIPTVIVSSLTERGKQITLDALEAGAVDIITKPRIGVVDGLPVMMGDVCERVKAAARVRLKMNPLPAAEDPVFPDRPLAERTLAERPLAFQHGEETLALSETTDRVIAIGASAGGVAALANILPLFPAASPGIVIVQHMPGGFTASFAERLNTMTAIRVKEAGHNDRVRPGLALLAPGGEKHMEVHRSGGEYRISLVDSEKVSGHKPSVDVLFFSIAKYVGKNAAVALLTGMGADGANGLLAVRQAGGRTIAQDEQSSVVWGMPGTAWEKGAAEILLPLMEIPMRLLRATQSS